MMKLLTGLLAMPMMSTDARYEEQVLSAYEAGKLESVATKAELSKLRAAARFGKRGPGVVSPEAPAYRVIGRRKLFP